MEAAVQLIGKYRENVYCIANSLVQPGISNHKMSAYLQEIAIILVIDRHLSTHTARHIFATNVTLTYKVSMEVVLKIPGHSSINLTKKYFKVVDNLIHKDMQKIHGKYSIARMN